MKITYTGIMYTMGHWSRLVAVLTTTDSQSWSQSRRTITEWWRSHTSVCQSWDSGAGTCLPQHNNSQPAQQLYFKWAHVIIYPVLVISNEMRTCHHHIQFWSFLIRTCHHHFKFSSFLMRTCHHHFSRLVISNENMSSSFQFLVISNENMSLPNSVQVISNKKISLL